jgi:hypothetical protein
MENSQSTLQGLSTPYSLSYWVGDPKVDNQIQDCQLNVSFRAKNKPFSQSIYFSGFPGSTGGRPSQAQKRHVPSFQGSDLCVPGFNEACHCLSVSGQGMKATASEADSDISGHLIQMPMVLG